MKIGNGPGGLDPSLIERIQDARTEAVDAASTSAAADAASGADEASSAHTPAASRPPSPPPTGLKLDALRVVEEVVTGKIATGEDARERILGAIVDTRFGASISRPERKRCMEMLRVTLTNDPNFKAEIDEMLVLAARELHTLPHD